MHDNFIGLVLFAVAGTFSPGPNNIMAMASGTAFGLRRTLPQIAGVTIGFVVVLIAFGLGLGRLFQASPLLHQGLRLAGAAYLLYLAWRIARAGDPGSAGPVRKPLTFMEAALFQWLNAKGLTLAVGVIAAFTTVGGDLAGELSVIVAVFAAATLATLLVWCLFGMAIRRALSSPRVLRATNLGLAGLLALSVVTLFL